MARIFLELRYLSVMVTEYGQNTVCKCYLVHQHVVYLKDYMETE